MAIDSASEYNTLRQELLEAKRYVFERTLAITALAAIGLQFFDKPLHIALPISIAVLTLFNFWFTIKSFDERSSDRGIYSARA